MWETQRILQQWQGEVCLFVWFSQCKIRELYSDRNYVQFGKCHLLIPGLDYLNCTCLLTLQHKYSHLDWSICLCWQPLNEKYMWLFFVDGLLCDSSLSVLCWWPRPVTANCGPFPLAHLDRAESNHATLVCLSITGLNAKVLQSLSIDGPS